MLLFDSFTWVAISSPLAADETAACINSVRFSYRVLARLIPAASDELLIPTNPPGNIYIYMFESNSCFK